MTSSIQLSNALRARVANHLYVSKSPYVDPNTPESAISRSKKERFHYSWHPDKAEAQRIKNLNRGYVQPIGTTFDSKA